MRSREWVLYRTCTCGKRITEKSFQQKQSEYPLPHCICGKSYSCLRSKWLRWVPEQTWYKPTTWFKGHWESKF